MYENAEIERWGEKEEEEKERKANKDLTYNTT